MGKARFPGTRNFEALALALNWSLLSLSVGEDTARTQSFCSLFPFIRASGKALGLLGSQKIRMSFPSSEPQVSLVTSEHGSRSIRYAGLG